MDIEQMAKEKLERIIEREGDANGERRKPYYLAALVDEIKRDHATSHYFDTMCGRVMIG